MTLNSAYFSRPTVAPAVSVKASRGTAPTLLIDETLGWRCTDARGQSRYLNIRFRLHGRLDRPLRVVLGGVSAGRQVQCWWRAHYGEARPFDPDEALILGLDWLDHPAGISSHDQADALARVLDHLKLGGVDDLIGASFGAMVGLAFAQRHGDRLRRLVAISGAHCARPASQALRQIQRAVIELGEDLGDPKRGVRWARALALTTYRPSALFDQQFNHADPEEVAESLASYLGHQGRSYSNDMGAARYRSLSKSLDSHCVIPELIRCPVELIGVDSDTLVPVSQLEELQRRLSGHSRLQVISSAYGHDAFLKENIEIGSILKRIISSLPAQEVADV